MKERDDLAERVRHAFWVALGLVIFVLLVPPALIGGKEDALGGFVEHYQTLITGVLAVFAAWATIREMRRVDAAQRLRHDEQMRLLQRTDHLAVMRCLDLVPRVLRQNSQHVRTFVEHPEMHAAIVGWTPDLAKAFAFAIQSVKTTLVVLSGEAVTQCAHLFTPSVKTALEHLRVHGDLCVGVYAEDFDFTMAYLPDVDRVAAWAPYGAENAGSFFNVLAELQDTLALEIELWGQKIA